MQLIEGYRIFFSNEAFYIFYKEYYNKDKHPYISIYDYKITMLKYELMNDDFIQDIQYKDIQYKYIFNEYYIYDPKTLLRIPTMIIIKNRMLLIKNSYQIYISSELSS